MYNYLKHCTCAIQLLVNKYLVTDCPCTITFLGSFIQLVFWYIQKYFTFFSEITNINGKAIKYVPEVIYNHHSMKK